MSSLQIQRLQSVLSGNGDVCRCTHPADRSCCIENGRIKCDDGDLNFWHIRFDPCMCQNPSARQHERCDCIIFAFDQTKNKQAMFVIEVKTNFNKPSLGIVREKIQYCIDVMQAILGGHMNYVEVIPILNDAKHSALCAQASMTQKYKVKCYGKLRSIILNHYQKNIIDYYKTP